MSEEQPRKGGKTNRKFGRNRGTRIKWQTKQAGRRAKDRINRTVGRCPTFHGQIALRSMYNHIVTCGGRR